MMKLALRTNVAVLFFMVASLLLAVPERLARQSRPSGCDEAHAGEPFFRSMQLHRSIIKTEREALDSYFGLEPKCGIQDPRYQQKINQGKAVLQKMEAKTTAVEAVIAALIAVCEEMDAWRKANSRANPPDYAKFDELEKKKRSIVKDGSKLIQEIDDILNSELVPIENEAKAIIDAESVRRVREMEAANARRGKGSAPAVPCPPLTAGIKKTGESKRPPGGGPSANLPGLGTKPCVQPSDFSDADEFVKDLPQTSKSGSDSFNCFYYIRTVVEGARPRDLSILTASGVTTNWSPATTYVDDAYLRSHQYYLFSKRSTLVNDRDFYEPGDIILVPGRDNSALGRLLAGNQRYTHAAVVLATSGGHITRIRQKVDPFTCVVDLTPAEFGKVFLPESVDGAPPLYSVWRRPH